MQCAVILQAIFNRVFRSVMSQSLARFVALFIATFAFVALGGHTVPRSLTKVWSVSLT